MPRGGALSDAELRALERAAAADPARTLEWTRALERVGRTDEAWVALCRAVDQPDVRAELARRPTWTHVDGPGGTRALDVPPVRHAPRLRWSTIVEVRRPRLLASAVGVVALDDFNAQSRWNHVQLDARDGRQLSSIVRNVSEPWIDGGLLLAGPAHRTQELHAWPLGSDGGPRRVEKLDAWLGPWLHRLPEPGSTSALGLLLGDSQAWVPPELRGSDFSPSSPSGGQGRVLTCHAPEQTRLHLHARIADGWLVFTITESREARLFGYDLARGALAWSSDGFSWAHDGAGALAHARENGVNRLRLRLHDGAPQWSVDDLHGLALGADVAVAAIPANVSTNPNLPYTELVVLDRASGRRRASLTPRRGRARIRPSVLITRDLILVTWDGVIQAHTLDGAHLWSFEVVAELDLDGHDAWITGLAPLPGALVVGLSPGDQHLGRVLCLEESVP